MKVKEIQDKSKTSTSKKVTIKRIESNTTIRDHDEDDGEKGNNGL